MTVTHEQLSPHQPEDTGSNERPGWRRLNAKKVMAGLVAAAVFVGGGLAVSRGGGEHSGGSDPTTTSTPLDPTETTKPRLEIPTAETIVFSDGTENVVGVRQFVFEVGQKKGLMVTDSPATPPRDPTKLLDKEPYPTTEMVVAETLLGEILTQAVNLGAGPGQDYYETLLTPNGYPDKLKELYDDAGQKLVFTGDGPTEGLALKVQREREANQQNFANGKFGPSSYVVEGEVVYIGGREPGTIPAQATVTHTFGPQGGQTTEKLDCTFMVVDYAGAWKIGPAECQPAR